MADDRGFKSKVAQKALMPVVAAAASALAGYVATKGPDFLEQKLLPKLKDATNGASDVSGSLPSRAKAAVGSVGDLASDLTDRAKDVVGMGGDSPAPNGSRRSEGISHDELQRHIEERAQARAERRKALTRR